MKPEEVEAITLAAIKKAQDASMMADPLAFLMGRISIKQAKDEAIESSKARVRADNQIRNSTKTPGEALPVVKVKVRKIQMPEEA